MRKAFVVLLALVLGLVLAQKPRVVVGTGSTGGVFFYYGTTLADLINRAGVAEAQPVQTGGSYDNLLLLRDRTNPQANTYYCALTTTDSAYVAYTGEEPRFRARKADSQRVMFYMYPSFIHIVTTEKTGIRVVQDLAGKRVSTGQPGSSTENLALMVLQAAGVRPESFAKRERLPVAEGAKALSEGTLDAFFWVGGVPTGSIVELSTSLARKGDRVHLIPIDPRSTTAQVALRRFPGLLEPTVVPRTVYNTRGDVSGLNTGNIVVCPESLPAEVAYGIMRAVFENLETLRTSVAAARDTSLENTARLFGRLVIPFHPGAERYLRERGVLR
ncbi:TAXI family TRAP transporter solute-binding subunit [Thermus thermamylovorans]|uniref:TAXI family TRAP transporter solute-binding subunit n=1 Tax=Thermus thermamylovorans TaxID=2509362 RepID=A0A4Q9B5H5_9DEIN|nr:TAXI family TRAP transporter solute-binding subunit [Thermus thermamylovorans]TBH20631.1 TAXI family TRAP transporter solute-binding subunit [Thermus thermamylovorans]